MTHLGWILYMLSCDACGIGHTEADDFLCGLCRARATCYTRINALLSRWEAS